MLCCSPALPCNALQHQQPVTCHQLPCVPQTTVKLGTGDPVEAVLLALEAAEKVFGVEVNSLGYKVPKNCGVIQGDGINVQMLDKILQAVLARGFSAQVAAFSCIYECLFTVLGIN